MDPLAGRRDGRLRSREEPRREARRRVKRGKEGLGCVWLPPSGAHLPSPQQSRTVRSDREPRRRSRTNDSPLFSPTIGHFPPPHDRATPRELFDLLPTLLSPLLRSPPLLLSPPFFPFASPCPPLAARSPALSPPFTSFRYCEEKLDTLSFFLTSVPARGMSIPLLLANSRSERTEPVRFTLLVQ